MDNPVDPTIVDLGLVNYVQHPTNPSYIVYRFSDVNRANSFEEELLRQTIWFEKSSEPKKKKTYYLFGIHKRDFSKTESINYQVEAKHKKPFIPFKGLRFMVMLFSFSILLLAILGYCHKMRVLDKINQNAQSLNTKALSE